MTLLLCAHLHKIHVHVHVCTVCHDDLLYYMLSPGEASAILAKALSRKEAIEMLGQALGRKVGCCHGNNSNSNHW